MSVLGLGIVCVRVRDDSLNSSRVEIHGVQGLFKKEGREHQLVKKKKTRDVFRFKLSYKKILR